MILLVCLLLFRGMGVTGRIVSNVLFMLSQECPLQDTTTLVLHQPSQSTIDLPRGAQCNLAMSTIQVLTSTDIPNIISDHKNYPTRLTWVSASQILSHRVKHVPRPARGKNLSISTFGQFAFLAARCNRKLKNPI